MTCTLGDVIAFLERCPPAALVIYDNGRVPLTVDSWREDSLALGLSEHGCVPVTVKELLTGLRAAPERWHQIPNPKRGYAVIKGCMTAPLYCSNYGASTEAPIYGGRCIIQGGPEAGSIAINADGYAVLIVADPTWDKGWEVPTVPGSKP